MSTGPPAPQRVLGRYAIYDRLAAGGMATVHIGRQLGAAGFARTVAIKRMLPHLSHELEFVTMFLDEARLAARVRHPNVVPILDVVAEDDEVFLVMEYVPGEALGALARVLRRRHEQAPPAVAASIVAGMLYGLHAAHEAVAEDGTPLHMVHRDVSPHNVLVGVDGVARLLDFGVAKAAVRLQRTTAQGTLKGKLAYMAPEQATRGEVTRHSDIYSVGVVLWELLAGRQLFLADNQAALMMRVLESEIPPLADVAPWVGPAAAAVVARAVAREPAARFASALDMAVALERALPPASPGVVGAWVRQVAAETLDARAAVVARVEQAPIPAEIPMTQPRSLGDITGGVLGALVARPPESTGMLAAAQPRPAGPASGTPPVLALPPRPRGSHRMAWALALGVFGLGVAAAAVGGMRWGREDAGGASGLPGGPPEREHAAGSTTLPPGATPPQTGDPGSLNAPGTASAQLAPGSGSPGAPGGAGDNLTGAPAAPDGGTLEAGPNTSAPALSARRGPWPPKPKSSCNPPYYIDSEGIRRVKRECFQ